MTYILTLISYFALLFGQIAAILLFDSNTNAPVSVSLIVNCAPILIFLRGVLHAKPRTHILLSMLVWFYFVLGVWNYGLETTRLLGIIQIIGSLAVFASSFFFIRRLQK